MTEKSYETIVSVLINSKLNAEKNNKDGVNDDYLANITSALEELKFLNEKSSMVMVRCISERDSMPGQIEIGKKYWIDNFSLRMDCDGDTYATVYLDEKKEHRVAEMLLSHFEPVRRFLNHNESLEKYVNTHTGFLLKDIIDWCLYNRTTVIAEQIFNYIDDHELNTSANMEKEFIINSLSYIEFAERGKSEEFFRYMGYDLYCIE